MLPVVAIALLAISPAPLPADISAVRITRIIDGDTVIADLNGTTVRVRLADIDAPELAQPHGPAAREFLVSLIADKLIRCDSNRTDRYGRQLATLFINGANINLVMVSTGHAWRYRYARKTGALADAEAIARAEGRGLWAESHPVEPWEFRKGRLSRAELAKPAAWAQRSQRREL